MAVEKNGAATAKAEGHSAVFTVLRQLLKPYEGELAIRTDKPGNCYLETRSSSLNGRRMFFCRRQDQKELRQLLPSRLVHVPRSLRQNLAVAEENDAGTGLLQLYQRKS